MTGLAGGDGRRAGPARPWDWVVFGGVPRCGGSLEALPGRRTQLPTGLGSSRGNDTTSRGGNSSPPGACVQSHEGHVGHPLPVTSCDVTCEVMPCGDAQKTLGGMVSRRTPLPLRCGR